MNKTKYLQTDARWCNLGYPKSPCTIGNSGCGEVSVVNCIIEMDKYKKYTPATIQPYCKQYAAPNCDGTYWSGIPAMMKHYGLTEVKEHDTMPQLFKELAKGDRVAIYLMGSRRGGSKGVHWTSSGHFVCSVDYKYKDGKNYVYVKDSYSNSKDRNGFISYEENMRGDVLKVWSGKLKVSKPKPQEEVEKRYIELLSERNVYNNVQKSKLLTTLVKGSRVYQTKRCGKWLYIDSVKGWICETDTKLGMRVKKISMKSAYFETTEKRPARAYPHKTDKINKWLNKGYKFKGRDLSNGYIWAEKIGWVNYKKTKPTSEPTPKPTVQEKMCAWAKKIADSGQYGYKFYTKDVKTHQCPICHNLKGKNKAWNCIGFAYACWHHGGGLPCKCSCDVINNATADKLLKANEKEALALAQKKIGLKDLKIIKNGGKKIPESMLKAGDIIYFYKNGAYHHTALYVGNGKFADDTSSRKQHIKYGVSYADANKGRTCKMAIRYTGK